MEINGNQSEVQKFYAGKTVFLTGASGFLGRLIVEKLLRTCKDLKRIYILLREKKGKQAEERFKEIFDVAAFSVLKAQQPDYLSKLSLLEGDLEAPYLGLTEFSKSVIREEVNCIFHVAATVRFDEKIRKASNINVRSTRDLLRLAKETKHLESFIYVSTAFSNCTRKDIDEIFYEPVITGDKLLTLLDCIDDNLADAITPALLQANPNTYVFTKAIAEEVVKSESKNLPVAIYRPSVVISTYKEPIPGWLDNLYGPTSILMGAALGLLKSVHGNKENNADIVPADFVINGIVVAAWDAAHQKNKNELLEIENHKTKIGTDVKIYNYTSSSQNPLTWGEYTSLSREFCLKVPSPLIIWHSTFDFNSNWYMHVLLSFLFQTIPAHIVDFIATCIGRKPMFVQTFKKIDKFCDVISYFTTHQWKFTNKNVQALWNKLNETDKNLFPFDVSCFTWREFFPNYINGARIYLLKDPLDSIPQGRRKLLAVKIGHYLIIGIVYLLMYKLVTLIWKLF